jgi:hypothetical protein
VSGTFQPFATRAGALCFGFCKFNLLPPLLLILTIHHSFHIPLFASLLTLSSSVLYILKISVGNTTNTEGEQITEDESKVFVHRAIWNMAASLSLIILSMTFQALADKPLDPPGTLIVNNRYIRLSSRVLYIIVIMTIPIKADITVNLFLGIAGVGLSMILWWEWIVSLEQPAKLLEPKGLTTLMKQKGIMGRRSS